jgi:hypothetical protein
MPERCRQDERIRHGFFPASKRPRPGEASHDDSTPPFRLHRAARVGRRGPVKRRHAWAAVTGWRYRVGRPADGFNLPDATELLCRASAATIYQGREQEQE